MFQLTLFETALHPTAAGLVRGTPVPRRLSGRALGRQSRGGDYQQLAFPVSPSVMVEEFHSAVGGVASPRPTMDISPQLQELRINLIREEAHELTQAYQSQDLVAFADALGDLAYVTFGAALTFGIDLDAVIAEIHRSNMTKLGEDGKPILRADGKVLKGPTYSPPCLEPILARSAINPRSALKIFHVAPVS